MKFRPGDLVRLKPAFVIAPTQIDAYNPDDWIGVITEITEEESDQVEIWGTCMVMWRGRLPVNEYLDHLELLGEAR